MIIFKNKQSVLVWKGDGSRLNARYLFEYIKEGRRWRCSLPLEGSFLSHQAASPIRPQGIADYTTGWLLLLIMYKKTILFRSIGKDTKTFAFIRNTFSLFCFYI